MGFISPTARKDIESSRPPFDRGAARLGPKAASAFAGGSHTTSYGAARRFSQPLSDLSLSMPSCHFQTGGTHGVRPSGDYSFHEASCDSSSQDYPLAVAPSG
jgi:hypothetical protein